MNRLLFSTIPFFYMVVDMEIPLLKDLIIIFGLSIGVLLICHRLKIPTIVGFLLTGILCGPHGLGVIKYISDVKILAEVGIIMLLFTVGMEFSIKKILEYKRFFLVGGVLQVALTTGAGVLIGQSLGRPMPESIFLGFLLSLSSTAIVLRTLFQREESNTPHGRLILGILIFQDLIVVPMLLVTPFLAGKGGDVDSSLLLLIFEGLLILGVIFYAALRIVPRLLYIVARTRSRELFLLTVLVICFSVAWIVSSIGLSLALGAFLAGLIISESEYKNQAIGDIIPFQDIFTSLFFVSIGMLLDLGFLLKHPMLILLITSGIFLMKFVIIGLIAILLGMPVRTALLAGFALAQVGEFSFILAKSGMALGIGSIFLNQLFLGVAILTMAMTPTLIALSHPISRWLMRLPIPEKLKTGLIPLKAKNEMQLTDHVIIIGYGISGKNLARSCKEAGIPYVILDMNPEKVRGERKRDQPIHFGDATHDRVLKHVNIQNAKVIAVLVNDPVATLHIVEHARHLNAGAYLIVRTRYQEEVKPMYDLGADDVVPDEFGASVEIFTRVLTKLDVGMEEIDRMVSSLRVEGFEVPRLHLTRSGVFSDLKESLVGVEVRSFNVAVGSPLVNKTLEEARLGSDYGVTVIVIRRRNKTIHRMRLDTVFHAQDTVVVIGTRESLDKVEPLFGSSEGS